MPNVTPLLHALLPALGIGLLIGAVRERSAKDAFAGLRTHGLAAVLRGIAPLVWRAEVRRCPASLPSTPCGPVCRPGR